MCQYHIFGSKVKGEIIFKFDNGLQEANSSQNFEYFFNETENTISFNKLILEVIKYYQFILNQL